MTGFKRGSIRNATPANINVEKMWAVVDAGETINPDNLKNQIEGGMLQSISWALFQEVSFDSTHINTLHW